MIEKLVKTGNDYILYSKDKTVLGITSGTIEGRMLSLKNCQAIENGYDLDELVVLSTKEETTIVGNQKMAQGFIKGFQKALELLGDKKYSEEDVKNVYLNSFKHEWFGDCIKSLQQTEWDVEIVIECGEVKQCECSSNENCLNPQLKLDENGCLILRRC